ncbi:MAG: 3D domain-containing protein [Clostridia bacterium]|nr:3D domain-containing protein [Clostridia bacterium]
MKLYRKQRAFIAAVSAFAMFISSSSSVMASFSDSSYESSARAIALGEYFNSNAFIVSMNNSATNVVNKIEQNYLNGVTYETKEETQAVPYNTIKRLNNSLQPGETVTVREGQTGEKVVSYEITYKNGTEISRKTVSEVVTKNSVDKIVEYRDAASAQPASGGAALDYKYVIECNATAYDLSPEENGGYGGQTATGIPLDKGVIAVDPKVIPLGSRVYVEALDGSWSYGYAVAGDTGGAIKGNRVDLCFRTRSECIQFGRRKCRVYVLS